MKESDWNKIKEQYLVLQNDLEPEELVSRLYQVKVLTDHDQDRIRCERPRLDKVKTLLEILRTKELTDGRDVYAVFLSHLKQTQGHLAEKLKPPGKPRRPPITTSEYSQGRNVDYIGNLDVGGLCQFVEPILKKHDVADVDKVLKSFSEEKITGRVFLNTNVMELKEICPHLKFGERKNIILERDEFIQQNQSFTGVLESRSEVKKGGLEQREYAREFDTNTGYTEKYQKGKVLENLQTSVGKLTDPIHLCIPLDDSIDVNSALDTIGWETVKFAAACMNERTNGTIHFGVYDGSDETHPHGEVAGLANVERKECQDLISSWIEKSFPPDKLETAKSCIHSPKYVDVINNNACTGFVLEIDVEPKAFLVGEEMYHVRDQFLQQGEKEAKQKLFRFKGGVPKTVDVDGIVPFMQSIPKRSKQRMEAEKVSIMKTNASRNLLKQLQEFLCDSDTEMGDVYPILVVSTVSKNMSLDELHTKFSFIGDIDWICVFDFDPTGCSSGIYNYLVQKQGKEFKLKLTDDFDQRGSNHPQTQGMDKLTEDMNSSHLTPWIFCNGYEKMDQQEYGVMEWKKQRSEGFKEAVRYFAYEIPPNRAKVVYLLLSKDYNVMLEAAAEELSLKFQDQWMVIAETDSVAALWQEQLICKNIVEEKSLDRRLLTGNRWEDIGTCIRDITGMTYASLNHDQSSLVTHLGTFIHLPKNIQNKLCDLEILSSTECGNLEKLNDEEKMKMAQEHETKFYQGHPPSWVNFYHGVHVLRRKRHDELMKNVDKVLTGDIPDNVNIGRVTIYHQPGSGGTTTAKQVLWDMKEKFRCCILRSYSKESHHQIVELWEHGVDNINNALPVLVMVDNLDDEKLENLTESLQDEATKLIQGRSGVMCVLLLCHRQSSLPLERERIHFVLRQELHPEEKNWFQSKYNDLADSFKRLKGPNPKHLLSLNIMKENFNERYIENTVAEILQAVTLPEERRLMKYVALVNAHDQQFRGVPVPCFDWLMAKRYQMRGRRWESNLSPSANMLLITKKSKPHVTSLRVINPLLSKWILSNLINQDQQSLGETVLEFLYSDACKFRHRDIASKQLSLILREMMKTREVTASGKTETFSRLIQELYDTNNVDTAAEILAVMFEKTTDPYIAQQLARMYILCENWIKAVQFANEATNLHPKSSYLWDTHGQIFKFRLSKLFESAMTTNLKIDKRLIQEAVEYAYEGTQRFLKVQELSCNEPSSAPNTAGFFGEIDICIFLLNTLCLVPKFKEKSEMQKFMNGKSMQPDELTLLTEKHLTWLRSLQGRVLTTLRNLEDEAYRLKQEQMNARPHRASHFFLKGNLDRLRQNLGFYFGDDDTPNLEQAHSLTPDKRRRLIRRHGINSLQSILKLLKEENPKEKIVIIYKLSQLNVDSQQPLPYDCRIALGSGLSLLQISQSPSDLPKFEYLLQASTVLYSMNYDGNYIDLEPYLYFLLLHWPTTNRKQYKSLANPAVLLDALNKCRNAYIQKYPKDKRGNFPVRDRPFFFLTKKTGTESIVHIDQLKESRGASRSFGNFQLGKILGTIESGELLERFDGVLSGNGWDVNVRLETPDGNKLGAVSIPLHTRESRQSLRNKKVNFVLGFGWSGPKACDIQTETRKYETDVQHRAVPQPRIAFLPVAASDLHQNITHQILTIKQHLRHISHLKEFPRNRLSQEQLQLIHQERFLTNRLVELCQEQRVRCQEFL